MKVTILNKALLFLPAVALLLLSCDSNMSLNDRNSSIDGPGVTGELKADFNVTYLCCGPTTGTGRFIDEAEVFFENKSTGKIESYEWGVSNQLLSTGVNPPSQMIQLNNSWPVNNRTFWLKVTDSEGNTDYMEKSLSFPMLMPTGVVKINGASYSIQPRDTSAILPSWPDKSPDWIFYDGTTTGGGWGFLGLNINLSSGMTGAPIPLTIRIGMNGFSSLLGELRQQSGYTPNVQKRFHMTGGGYSTYDDPNGIFSDGYVFLTELGTEISSVIDEIYVQGIMRNSSGDEINVSVLLNYTPHQCHYYYLFCFQWD